MSKENYIMRREWIPYRVLFLIAVALTMGLVIFEYTTKPAIANPVVEAQEWASKTEEVLDLYRINLNTADTAELMQIPGIGQVLAGRIIEFREQHGPFASVDDLVQVYGIGEKTVEQIKLYAYVE